MDAGEEVTCALRVTLRVINSAGCCAGKTSCNSNSSATPSRTGDCAVVTFLVTLTVLPIIKGFIAARRRRWTETIELRTWAIRHSAIELTTLLVARTSRVFLFAVALFLASRHLIFPPRLERVIEIVIVCLFWLQVGLWAMATVRFGIDQRRRAGSTGFDSILTGSIDIILFCAGLIIWAMVAAAGARQPGRGDQAAARRPRYRRYRDRARRADRAQRSCWHRCPSRSTSRSASATSLTIDNFQGTVEHIGVKSTRLRSISGEQIIIANADIIKARVRNFGRMRDRRAVFQFGVNYDTTHEVLAAIPAEVRKIVEAQADTRFDRCHFLTYGDTALQFETVFYATKPDFNTYADAQQKINLAIFERLRAMNVNLNPPTRNVVRLENAPTTGTSAESQSLRT